MSNITFTMLKPDSIRNKNTGAIIDKIIKAGFVIKAMKFTRMSNDQASNFYAIHKDKPFFTLSLLVLFLTYVLVSS